ncbi:MAG: hypothetical protein K8R41_06830 [Bacteroidales bacterium]|nr:hypothetical protein [Bacteroidales bacterium]
METKIKTIKKATIYFNYSFMPSSNDFTLKDDDIEKLYKALENEDKLKDRINDKYNFGKPKERIGISSFNSLEHKNIGYLQLPEMLVKIDSINLTIEPLFRFFPNGSTLTFKVETQDSEIDQYIIHKVLHMVSQERNEKADVTFVFSKEIDKASKHFYKDFFNIDTKEEEKEIVVYHKEKELDINYTPEIKLSHDFFTEENQNITLFQLFKGLVEKYILVASKEEKLNEKEKKDKKDVLFKLKCKEYLNTNEEEPRTPWVITVLDVDDELNEILCSGGSNNERTNAILEKSKLIAPILYRSVSGSDFELEPSYPFLPKRLNFFNLNLDSRLYVDISRRSILCIKTNEQKYPAYYFIPVLLDISEMTFSRWQSLLIINKIIDEALKNFTEKSLSAGDRVKKIMNLLNKFSACIEDTSNYFIGGDALREIHDKLIDNFKVNDLMNITLRKIDMLERTYKYQLEQAWTEPYKVRNNE